MQCNAEQSVLYTANIKLLHYFEPSPGFIRKQYFLLATKHEEEKNILTLISLIYHN